MQLQFFGVLFFNLWDLFQRFFDQCSDPKYDVGANHMHHSVSVDENNLTAAIYSQPNPTVWRVIIKLS